MSDRSQPITDRFLFGASVYPELQSRDEWTAMLDQFQRAKFTALRLGESAWGNLEPAPGTFDFDWLGEFLDEMEQRGLKAVLGSSTYIAPQWLAAEHPGILAQWQPALPVHPMYRKAASLSHPIYREACRRFVGAVGATFRDHPAVIGWQLDNEIDAVLEPDYNPETEKAWTEWLKRTYRSVEELNERLGLVSWGMKVSAFEDLRQPTFSPTEGSFRLPALTLANLHFRRDVIFDFLVEQARLLRQGGVQQWITTNWRSIWTALGDDPRAREILDVGGLNLYPRIDIHTYPRPAESANYWSKNSWHMDMMRAAYGRGQFLVTETRFGVTGQTTMHEPFPSRAQFRMWMLQEVAFGACGLVYWTGNRWHGGHWPHWGGLLDWSGQPEPDFEWVVELGAFFEEWGERLVGSPIDARAVVLTDFDLRAALQVYPHTPASQEMVPRTFEVLHRLGIGVDSINLQLAADPANLRPYALVLIPAATTLDGDAVPRALEQYVNDGGNVLILPYTAYQHWDGVFRRDGFAANLARLTGTVVSTGRRLGTAADSGQRDHYVTWQGSGQAGRSPIGVDGFCELLSVGDGTEVLARLEHSDAVLDGRPVAATRRLGNGRVLKLGFWPADDSLVSLVRTLVPDPEPLLASPAPVGVHVAPRTDGSIFCVNTSDVPATIQLARSRRDRLSTRTLEREVQLEGFEVVWLEQTGPSGASRLICHPCG